MVDIHCHVLPGVDDGAPNTQVALEMLRGAADEGIGAAVVTPHIKPSDGRELVELHQRRLGELREAVDRAGIAMELHQGAELGFRFGLDQVAQWPSVGLAGGPYVLVDLPSGPLSPWLEQAFFELRAGGYRPILAHPERHRELARSKTQMQRLRHQDLLFQVDAGSFTGLFGRRAQAAAEMMLQEGWVAFAGSDGHDLSKRPLSLLDARQRVEELCGADEATRLFCHNPAAVIQGEPIVNGASTPPPSAAPAARGWRRLLQRHS